MNRTITINQSEFKTLYEILEQRLNKLKDNINKHSEKLDKYESNIKNYTTYALFMKLHTIKSEEDIKEGALSDLYMIEGDDNAYKNHDYQQGVGAIWHIVNTLWTVLQSTLNLICTPRKPCPTQLTTSA